MALQVWLPLNNSIQNKGLNKATVTTYGTTTYADGRAGRCLSCNGNSYWKISPLTLGTAATISFWAQTTDTNAMFYVLGAASYAHLNFWRANNKYYLNKGDSYNNPFQKNGADVAWHGDGKWHHYVTVFNGTSCLLYVDGAYYGTAKTYASPACNGTNVRLAGGFGDAHSYDTSGLISDFRVYDNCLTIDDINELYQNNVYHFVPYWKHNSDSVFGDASYIGRGANQHGYNIVQSGSSIYFNGNAYISGNTLGMKSGGTLSVWFNCAKPTSNQWLYSDTDSCMCLSFYQNGTYIIPTLGMLESNKRYSTAGINWGSMNNVTVVYGTDRKVANLYINGVAGTQSGSDYWSSGTGQTGTFKIGGFTNNYYTGYINSVRVYGKQLTQSEIAEVYNKGIEEPDESVFKYVRYSGCTWLKVLHHNTPATKLFTAANGKNNNDKDLYSRLGLFDSNTNFRMMNGNYEFMVKEKLESTHNESAATWVQTSSPTASTLSGYQLLTSSPGAPPRTFGLCHQSANAVFDISTQDWWCACGCNTAYQGGIPGFWGVVKTGYIDLYIRVDDTKYYGIEMVPDEYTPLQYIEATGTQWIDTNLSGFNTDDWEIFCEWKISSAPAGTYAYVFGVYESENNNTYRVITNQKSTTDYFINPNSKAGGGSIGNTGLATASTHTVIISGNGKFVRDGSSYTSGTFGTALPEGNTMGLFRTKTSNGIFTNFFKGRICIFWAKKGGSFKSIIVPVKRKSDNVVGAYDVIRKMFLPNSGTGTFTAGPVVTI